MAWPPTLTDLKNDLKVDDDRDDARLSTVLAAAVAYVERVRPAFAYPGTPDVGDVVTLSITAADVAGDPANADTVELVVELPDGTLDDSPTVDNPPDDTGVYLALFTTTQAGTHVARWITSGPVSAVNQRFEVRSSAGLPAPTADMELGTVRLAGRYHARRRSVDGLVVAAELGVARVPYLDPDIRRLLGLGKAVFA